jgi:type I restriction enzyme M protein
MISKMLPPEDGGSRIGIVFNGSPLSTGDPGNGENEIRRWIIENHWLETIIALPDQLFYNTGILTYVWIITNRKKGIRRIRFSLLMVHLSLSGCVVRWEKNEKYLRICILKH